jgi:hypothetical protein
MFVLLRPGILLITFVSGILLGALIGTGGRVCLPATPLPPRTVLGLPHPAVWNPPPNSGR